MRTDCSTKPGRALIEGWGYPPPVATLRLDLRASPLSGEAGRSDSSRIRDWAQQFLACADVLQMESRITQHRK